MPLNQDSGQVENYKIFIAYETSTGDIYAHNLKEAIIKRHEKELKNGKSLNPFFASEDLRKIETISSIIDKYLKQCKVFIPIFTFNAPDSPAMKKEINYVLKKKNEYKIIVCQHNGVKDTEIPKRLNSYIKIVFNTPSDLANKVMIELGNLLNQYPNIFSMDLRSMDTSDFDDLEPMGICRIFRERRDCPELDECIRDEIQKSTEIKIMANTARDFFGETAKNPKFLKDMLNYLASWKKKETTVKPGVKKSEKRIKLILLNPFSEAAFDRYTIEYWGATIGDQKGLNNYIGSTYFRDIENVIRWYANNNTYHKFIELRFSSLTPTLFLIRTKNYTFIEFYHNGPLKLAGIDVDKKDKGATCIGGYLPVLMISNTSKFGKLMDGHFDFSWDKSEPWKDTEIEIEKFKKDPKLFRLLYLVSEFNKKSEDIHLE